VTDRPSASREAELRANALRAANGRSQFARAPRLTWLWEWAKVFPAAVLVFFVMRTFFVEAYKIPSGSMERTLLVGDFLLVNKLVYGAELPFSNRRMPALRSPQHGDVIVFEFPVDPSKNFVKRLIGLPGDTVSMRDGQLLRNGQPLDESYVVHTEPGVDPVTDDFRWQRSHLVKSAVAAPVNAQATASLAAPVNAGQGLVSNAGEGYRPSRNNWGPLVVPTHQFFVLGDNRDNSLDSRYWGFVPDSLLRGTPLFVYYSFVPDSGSSLAWLTKIRWARLGTRVH
jgi:signal peptidase I